MDIVSATKTDTFRMRINPEIRRNLESVYAKSGLTLTDAVNVFFQQSLNAGGLPFLVTEDNAELVRAKALKRLLKELEEGLSDPISYSEDEIYQILGVEK
ncbi:phosphatase [Pseudoflavonifractor sp. 60]|uniref:type II toxin-antitoxin system RelB/DinJ family antitoxin n=1 Tax=Pseudoflavonifractor sp. 60 TaxID=2304576 RepID=UPI00136BDA8D|nr:type II toxin-antitoxin system RelB/DinJ family antitoxin [Pseudoflavonifractor sp. 60]NBI69222.1 phosphatase [Pseudoflavonifractor sp. 60]